MDTLVALGTLVAPMSIVYLPFYWSNSILWVVAYHLLLSSLGQSFEERMRTMPPRLWKLLDLQQKRLKFPWWNYVEVAAEDIPNWIDLIRPSWEKIRGWWILRRKYDHCYRWWQVKACPWKNSWWCSHWLQLSNKQWDHSSRPKVGSETLLSQIVDFVKWPNQLVLPFRIWRIDQGILFQQWRRPLKTFWVCPCFWARRFKRPCSMQSLRPHYCLSIKFWFGDATALMVGTGRKDGVRIKMEQFFKKCKRFKPLCLIKQGTITRPTARNRCRRWSAVWHYVGSWNFSEHPQPGLVLSAEKGLLLSQNFQDSKGSKVNDQQLVTWEWQTSWRDSDGSGAWKTDGRLCKSSQNSDQFVCGWASDWLDCHQDAPKAN